MQEQTKARYDAVILGAGISGLTAASHLAGAHPDWSILVLDEYGHAGGNHISLDLNGYSFDIGSFIFRSDAAHLNAFPVLRRLLVPRPVRIKKLNPAGKITDYPFSVRDDVLAQGLLSIAGYGASLLWGRMARRQMRNAADFCRFWIGERFFVKSGLEHYIERFFGVAADRIDLEFARKRMTWISDAASLGRAARRLRRSTAKKKKVEILVRPRAGFAFLYDAVRTELASRGVSFRLGATLHKIAKAGERTLLTTDTGTISAARVFSTIPVARAAALCGIGEEVDFDTIELVSLFFSHAGDRGFDSQILYNFTTTGRWKRLTVYSDLYGKVRGRDYLTVEVNRPAADFDLTLLEADFRATCAKMGILRGDLILEGSFSLTSAYPALLTGAPARAARMVERLRTFGLESFGRQGQFDYIPTAHRSVQEVGARDWDR